MRRGWWRTPKACRTKQQAQDLADRGECSMYLNEFGMLVFLEPREQAVEEVLLGVELATRKEETRR